MASYTSITLLALLAILLLQVLSHTSARNLAINNGDKKLEPEWFGKHDRSFLVPGIGQVIVPKKGQHVNPITYNPTTGKNGGNGVSFPGLGGSTAGRSYIPGGDDNIEPNPGMEVPVPSGH